MTLSAFGMNLHAATTADGRDRKQLERICRYLLRPPFAHDAVTALSGGCLRVSFKAPWRSGTAHADMDAHQFLARLCDMIDHRWQVLPYRSGPMGQVSVCARVATGASWGRLGIDKPRGLRSLLGCKAADPGEVPRFFMGTCAATRSPAAVQNWFNSGSFSRPTEPKPRIPAN
jgi:hypothetical protein